MSTALKYSFRLTATLFVFLISAITVSAHSSVSPSQTEPSKYETFTLSVPTEREVPTTEVRLLVPESLDRVTPFVKPGWRIEIKKEGERVTEMIWRGGIIPAGQKDVFAFTARTPQEPTMLIWRVYQTYQGGEVVAWDQAPGEEGHNDEPADEVSNPYSTTEISETISGEAKHNKRGHHGGLPTILSIIAVLLAASALWRSYQKA